MLGGMREKAEDAANSGIDKATDFAKEKSGGKFDDQIDQGSQMAKDNADKIDGQEG
ncbi:MAG: antitoxin [Nonomuraea sp.]|nr:antitoxin [Nonomuraea sp.]